MARMVFKLTGDVVPYCSIAASGASGEAAIFVAEADRGAVHLRLQHILYALARQQPADAGVKFAHLAFAVGLVQGKHRRDVSDDRKLLQRLAADPLRRRVGGNQVREFSLQLLKLDIKLVVIAVGNLGLSQHIVEVVVTADLLAQGCDSLFRFEASHSCQKSAALLTALSMRTKNGSGLCTTNAKSATSNL